MPDWLHVIVPGVDGSSSRSSTKLAFTTAASEMASTSASPGSGAGSGSSSASLRDSLPENAREFYLERTEKSFSDLVHKLSTAGQIWRTLNLIRIYPLSNLRYLASNQCVTAVVNGEHRLYCGPGFQWTVGLTDRMGRVQVIGTDVDFGPIKLIYVKPGTLKFACFSDTGRPLLLAPGLHYFNNLNLRVGREIDMNFGGENKVIPCDDRGAFSFVFVKAGSAAIVILRDGTLSALPPGLHFLVAPDALRGYTSVQQEHFRFGTCDAGQCFLTADNVELHINATIFYRVIDPVTLFTVRIKSEEDLLQTLHSQAMSTLLTIVRSEAFGSLGKRAQVKDMHRSLQKDMQLGSGAAGGGSADETIEPAVAVPVASAPPSGGNSDAAKSTLESITLGFQSIVHDAEPLFRKLMGQNFNSSGIEIQSLRIEQIEFADKSMQKQVSEFAMTNTKLQSQQQTISAQRAIQVAEAERDAATLMIKKKAEADSKLLLTDTDNLIKIKTARAEAENRLILAEAEAQAKIKIGEAELAIQEKQNNMPNAQLRIFTEAQKEIFSGVQKVIYTDQQSMLLKPYLQMPDLGLPGGN